jgi:hypothetical protein
MTYKIKNMPDDIVAEIIIAICSLLIPLLIAIKPTSKQQADTALKEVKTVGRFEIQSDSL